MGREEHKRSLDNCMVHARHAHGAHGHVTACQVFAALTLVFQRSWGMDFSGLAVFLTPRCSTALATRTSQNTAAKFGFTVFWPLLQPGTVGNGSKRFLYHMVCLNFRVYDYIILGAKQLATKRLVNPVQEHACMHGDPFHCTFHACQLWTSSTIAGCGTSLRDWYDDTVGIVWCRLSLTRFHLKFCWHRARVKTVHDPIGL